MYQQPALRISHHCAAALAAAAALTLAACSDPSGPLELRGQTMGTAYSVRIVVPPDEPDLNLEGLSKQIAARLDELEDHFSTYRPDSEIRRFNAFPEQEWFPVSPVFMDVFRQAMSVNEVSGGAFDPTVGPLVDLWGFGAGGDAGRIPQREEVQLLLASTGFTHLQLRETPAAVRRMLPGVQLDFSAIAKGNAVDEVWHLLSEAGLSDYLVEIGGEVRTRGIRADGGDWSIGIESPDGSGVTEAVRLRDAAIATSGDYRNYFQYQGQRYSHLLDPRTGWPVAHDLTAVSVISDTAAMADALATALLVLGPTDGFELANRQQIAARLVVQSADGLTVLRTPAFEAALAGNRL